MIRRQRIKSSRFLLALALTVIVFMIGFASSSWINQSRLDAAESLEQSLRTESLSNELMLQIIQRDQCAFMNTTAYDMQLASIGKKLTYMESIYGFGAPEVVNLKNYYSLLQVRHMMLQQGLNEHCGSDRPILLYFYTNDGCDDCTDQGLVLNNIHAAYPVFTTYAFEFATDNGVVQLLEQRYGIVKNRLPALVYGNETLYGFRSKEYLTSLLDLENRWMAYKTTHPDAR